MTDGGCLHITFGESATRSLKMALATLGLEEPVAVLVDDFSMGPLDPGNAEQRAAWKRVELGSDEPIALLGGFWERVAAWRGKLVAWMSSRAVVELCGLHALLWRLPDIQLHVIDVANVNFRPENAPQYDERQAFAIVRGDRIVQNSLMDSAKQLTEVDRSASCEVWSKLTVENAPLRVLTEAGLVSKPIEFFDDQIRELITDDWQKCARVVGEMMERVRGGDVQQFHSVFFIYVRLLHLLDEADDLEGRNDDGPEALWSMHTSWVRRRKCG